MKEAEALYRQILRKSPSDVRILYLLGTACSQLERFGEAEKLLKKSLALQPKHPEALNNLGLTLRGSGKIGEAITSYRRALALKSDYADAHNNLGGALEFTGKLDEAESHLRKALQLNPEHADAYYNLGLVLKGKDRFEEAVQCFRRGLELKPDFSDAYTDLAAIYKIWGRHDEALACIERALQLNPAFYSAHVNHGAILEELGRLDEAHAAYQEAIALNPDDVIAKWNMAYLYLKQGILDRGWEAHEMRFQMGMASKRFPFPEWDGSSLEGKTILVYAEQGLGDEILFASCIPDVVATARHCVIECEPRLAPLFSRSFPNASVCGSKRDQVGWLTEAPPIDVQIAAGSLPRFLRPELASFPDSASYLVADANQVEYWRSRVAMLGPGLKVGICWRSGLTSGERSKQYSQLTQWDPIFATPGVHFINLQYGECTEELQEAQEKFGIEIASFPELDLKNDIDGSAALISELDLVITAATAVCEIAGGVGTETYRINIFGKQWEYLGTDAMPWHPSVTLFCQPVPDDWETPLALIADSLREKVQGHEGAVEYVRLGSGAEIAIDASPEDVHGYVLKEHLGGLDPEYDFVLGLAEPGARMLDIDAGVGTYALALAQNGARMLALTKTATDTGLLMKSRAKNRLENSVGIAILDRETSLDSEMDRHGLDDISFVRISQDFSTRNLVENGKRFLTVNSPLVLFGIRQENTLDMTMAEAFRSFGYDLFRLVPGLDLLISFLPQDLDAFSLNLFACKPDRAKILEERGLLCRNSQSLENLPNFDIPLWQEYLGTMPYASGLSGAWLSSQKSSGWEAYWTALNLYSMAKNIRDIRRHAWLEAAGNLLKILVRDQATLPRLLTLCRILVELGRREMAVNLLNHICSMLDSGMQLNLDEPFLALSPEYERANPAEHLPEWIVATILEQRERLRTFSSFFTGSESLPILEEIQKSSFLSPDMKRRMALIRTRSGILS